MGKKTDEKNFFGYSGSSQVNSPIFFYMQKNTIPAIWPKLYANQYN